MRLATVCAWLCSWAVFWPLAAVAQLPTARLYGVFPAGGQAGSRFELKVAGADLDGTGADGPARLIFSHPGIAAEPALRPARLTESGPQVVPNRFVVSIASEVAPGTYEVRVQGRYGLSNPRAFVVGSRPEVCEVEPNNERAAAAELAIEAVANGVLEGDGDVDVYRLSLGSERTLIICEARQVDSRAIPTLVLYDEQGAQLDVAAGGLAGRAILDVTPQQPATYYVAVHDAAYGGDGMFGYVYRLRATTGPYVDLAFPSAVPAGQTSSLTLFGRNLGGKRAMGVRIGGHELEQVTVTIDALAPLRTYSAAVPAAAALTEGAAVGAPPEAGAGSALAWGEYAAASVDLSQRALDGFDYVFTSPTGAANPVRLYFAAAPLILEREPNNLAGEAQCLQPPCEAAGRFSRADRDWYFFDARAGEAFWIEVVSHRLGLAADPLLVIQQLVHDEQGNEQAVEVAAVDDVDDDPDQPTYTESKDPALLFEVPAGGRYRLLVRDLSGNPAADPRLTYRLVIRQAEPDFCVAALPRTAGVAEDPNDRTPAAWPLVLRAGGVETIDLVLYRRDGFAGEVEVRVEGLPAGVSAAPAVLGPGISAGSLALVAEEGVEPSLSYLRVVARGMVGGRVLEREALVGTVAFDPRRPPLPRARASATLPLCVLGEPAPFAVRLGEPQAEVLQTCRAGRLTLPISVVRRGAFQGNIYFYLRGGPRGIQQLNELNLDGSTTAGTLQLVLPGDCPPGRYTLSLMGVAEVPYARNPEAAAAAAARKAAIEAALPEVQAAVNRAAEVRGRAEQALAESQARLEEGRAALQAAEQALAQADATFAQAADEHAAAQHAANDAPADAGLAERAQQAARRLEEAQHAPSAARAALQEAQKEFARREHALAVARDRFDQAQQALVQAEGAAAEAAEWFAEVERLAAELAGAAAQRGYGVAYPSTSLSIDVAESPVALTVPSELRLAPGASAELPVAIVRLFGFEDAVSVELLLEGGVPGLSVSSLYMESQQTEGSLRVEAAADAPSGTYAAVLRLSLGFNGQGVEVRRPLRLVIADAASPESDAKDEHGS